MINASFTFSQNSESKRKFLPRKAVANGAHGAIGVTHLYGVLIMPRRFFRQTGNSTQYECLTCNTVHTYSNEDSLRILNKPRNEKKVISSPIVGKNSYSVSFRYFCSFCGHKTMQTPISKPYNDQQQKELNSKFAKIAILFFCFIALALIGVCLLQNLL